MIAQPPSLAPPRSVLRAVVSRAVSRAATRLVPALLGVGLTACSADMALSGFGDTGLANIEAASRSIRVDVLPEGGVDALPQSALYGDVSWEGLSIELAETVRFSGTVTGTVNNPYAAVLPDVEVPGQADVALEADVQALLVGQIDGAATVSNDRGSFSMSFPRGGPYRLSVVPVADDPLPFLVVEERSFLADAVGEQVALGAGQAVYGRVLQSDGSPLPQSAMARLEHESTGVLGPPVPVGDGGHYLLRALPGDYRVTITGDSSSSYLPRVSAPVTVTDEGPAEVDFDLGALEPVDVRFEVAGASAVDGLSVRFLSESLTGVEGTATVAPFSQSGEFRTELLPGVWTIEVIPDFDPDGQASPLRIEGLVVAAGAAVELEPVVLPPRVEVSGVVTGSLGDEPLEGVLVSAREVGFDGNVYSARTDADGRYTLLLPDVALDVSFTPAVKNETTTWVSVDEPAQLGNVKLARGETVSGRVTLTGDPVPYSVVEVRDGESGALYATTFTDANGDFTVRIDHQGSIGDISQPGVDTGLDSGR